MDYVDLWLTARAVVLGLMVLLWLLSLALRNSSIVDIIGGMGFAIVTWIIYALAVDALPWGFVSLVDLYMASLSSRAGSTIERNPSCGRSFGTYS